MKKLIVIILAIIFISLSFAQSPVDKGTYKIGGGLSYKSYYYKNKELNYYEFSLKPEFYYYLLKNLSIGISTEYLYSKTESGYKYKRIDLAPGIIYNLHYKNIYPFIYCCVCPKFIWNKRINANNTYVKLPYLKVGCGLDIFVSKNISIEPYVYYTFDDISKETSLKNSIGIGIKIATFLH